eukprot:949508_1
MMQSQIRKPLLLVLICFMFFTTSCASMDDDSMYDDYKENADSLANVDAQKTKELVNEGYAYVSAVAALATHNNNLEEALKNLNESYDGGSYKLKQYRLPNHGQNPLPPGPRAFDRDVNQRFAKSNARSNPMLINASPSRMPGRTQFSRSFSLNGLTFTFPFPSRVSTCPALVMIHQTPETWVN